YGTKNFSKEAAMTREDAIQALEVGISLGDEWFSQGYKMIATGELGIGNTSTSSAVLSVLCDLDVDETCGLGSGLEPKMFENKKFVIRRGIEINRPESKDPIDVLAKVGGFDIAAMAGVFLSGAKNHIPVVVD
ncbi:nicotinate-nucleotide--dimethylbenzimidazole phosphoribosyltransferase, partial [Bacillus licheniformis]|uniref:nicotinate-nucleotide--dimethylbenzimidazole phosphoribosyltransferase n=1 Tax=Bacillus licheniformis TaxID=1402 RepID=UPI000FA517DA